MVDETPAIRELHELYWALTGFKDVRFDRAKMETWNIWRSHGWGKEELELVIRFVREEIFKERRWRSSLYFRNLIANTDTFEEFLADARARGRLPKMDKGKAEVLRATGRMEEQKARPRSAEQVMRDEAAFNQFREWRAQNGI